jgi:hypothetical protein
MARVCRVVRPARDVRERRQPACARRALISAICSSIMAIASGGVDGCLESSVKSPHVARRACQPSGDMAPLYDEADNRRKTVTNPLAALVPTSGSSETTCCPIAPQQDAPRRLKYLYISST